jgi:hypothetical protein
VRTRWIVPWLALAAVLTLFEAISPAVADTVIFGQYSFTASGFGPSAPISDISGSFGFTYTYPSSFPPISGQDPLLIPTSLNLSFNFTTFATTDTRVDLLFGDFGSQGEPFTHLAPRLEARDDHQLSTGNYFILVFLLNPDGSLWPGGGNNPFFMYSLDQNLPNGNHYYSTNTVALTCAPGECAVNDPPPSLDFVLSSVPEPSTWAMMLIGFAGLGFVAYRSRQRKPA